MRKGGGKGLLHRGCIWLDKYLERVLFAISYN